MTDWFSDLLFWIIFGAILLLLRRQKIFWTVGALALLLLFNQFFTPGFFHIQLLDGHFYGSRIDVLNQGAKVMLLSLGMSISRPASRSLSLLSSRFWPVPGTVYWWPASEFNRSLQRWY
jgi:hypothetical protein